MRTLSILFILLSLACKNKHEASSSKETTQQETSEPRSNEDKNANEQSAKQKIVFPDQAIARIQRTACFGRCPIYTLTVFNDGSAKLKAEKWLDQEGDFTAKVDQKKIDKLMQKANEIGFFELNNEYDSDSVTDLPSTITTLRRGDELKQIVNRYQGPEKLSNFEKYFDELYLKLDWEKTE